MSGANDNDFGGTEKDLEGQMVTRKVQDGGRINFPEDYLDHSGVDTGDRVFIIVEDGGLRVVEANAKRLAATGVAEGMKMIFGSSEGEN